MLVRGVMTRDVECIGPNDTIKRAAETMRNLDVGVLPVCDNDRLVGMITDRDITIRATVNDFAGGTKVRDIMTPKVIYCFEDDAVEEASRLMRQNQIRRLVVLNNDKRLIGILSLGDLAVDTHDEELAGATLEGVSVPAKPRR